MAFELIRLAALERGYDRARPGWQPHLEAIEIAAEAARDLAMESYQLDKEDLARFGRPLPRLLSFDPDGCDRAAYAAMPKGQRYRLNGRVMVKEAA